MVGIRRLRLPCLLVGLFLLSAADATGWPGGSVPFIKFDDGSPTSPDVGKLKATGTYDDGGAVSSSVAVWYREKGTATWTTGSAGASGGAWIYQTASLKSTAVYEVKPVLSYIPKNGGNQVLEGTTKEVTIK
jgi:hypothetical protein